MTVSSTARLGLVAGRESQFRKKIDFDKLEVWQCIRLSHS